MHSAHHPPIPYSTVQQLVHSTRYLLVPPGTTPEHYSTQSTGTVPGTRNTAQHFSFNAFCSTTHQYRTVQYSSWYSEYQVHSTRYLLVPPGTQSTGTVPGTRNTAQHRTVQYLVPRTVLYQYRTVPGTWYLQHRTPTNTVEYSTRYSSWQEYLVLQHQVPGTPRYYQVRNTTRVQYSEYCVLLRMSIVCRRKQNFSQIGHSLFLKFQHLKYSYFLFI